MASDAARQFEHALTRILRVSKDELVKRETAWKKARKAKARRKKSDA